MRKFSSAEAIKYGWREMMKNFWFFAGICALACVSYYVLNVALGSGFSRNILVNTCAVAVSLLMNIIIGMGIIHISLKIYDRREIHYDDIVHPAPLFFRYLGASIIYCAIILAGLFLFIVPGVIWSIKYGFFPYVMLDHKSGIEHAFKKSAEITKGAKLELFALGILLGLINFLGLIPLGLGFFLTIPTGWMAAAYAYRRLSR